MKAEARDAEWDASLETGLPEIDEQHKALFRQIRILFDRSQDNRLPATLSFLEFYVVEHFGTEERLHARTGYPKAEEHRRAHQAFVATFLEIRRKYNESGRDLIVLMELTKTLLDWLRDHVGGMDRDFGRYHGPGKNGT